MTTGKDTETRIVEAVEASEERIAGKIETVAQSLEGLRAQNSAEHGSLFSKLTRITEMVAYLKSQWEKFTRL